MRKGWYQNIYKKKKKGRGGNLTKQQKGLTIFL